MVNFATYKKNHKKLTENISKKLDAINNKGIKQEEGFWLPTIDKAGNGWAIIRFLPPGGQEEDPFVQITSYAFQGPTGLWYIEKSRSTLGKDEADPCDEFRSELWATDKERAVKYPRKMQFVSNILVVKDPEKPENNGKVFLFKYGKQIHDKISESFKPKISDESPIDPFDVWEGANFKLIIGRKDKYPTYENSKFDNPSPMAKNDKEIETIFGQLKELQPLIAPDKFKTYEELKRRLDRVMGLNSSTKYPTAEAKRQPEKAAELSSEEVESLDDLIKDIDVEDSPF